MAVVERKDGKGPVFYAVNEWNGRQKSERVGRNRRDAERRDAAMKKEIVNGTYQPPKERKSLTVGDIVTMFNGKRANKAKSTKEAELALAKNHLEPRVWLWEMSARDLRPHHCDKLIGELREVLKKDGTHQLSDRSIMDAIGVLRRSFASAVRAELCDQQPILIEPGTWNHQGKTREPYTTAETIVLTHHHKIPQHLRVLAALWLLAGLRQGEGCGLKWKRLDLDSRPLACLTIAEQWQGQPLKTKRTRLVPVHPVLLAILRQWAEVGFEAYAGRKPTPEDYIVPELDGFLAPHCYDPHASYRAFAKACAAVGIAFRTVHSCRHTFVTLCRRGGARGEVLERVSHNASGKVIDRYTHFDWEPLCEAVLCMRLESLPNAPPLAGNAGVSALPGSGQNSDISRAEPLEAAGKDVSSTALSVTPGHKRSRFRGFGGEIQATIQGNGGESAGSEAEDEEAFGVALAEHSGAQPPTRSPKSKSYIARRRASFDRAFSAVVAGPKRAGVSGPTRRLRSLLTELARTTSGRSEATLTRLFGSNAEALLNRLQAAGQVEQDLGGRWRLTLAGKNAAREARGER